MKKIFLISDSPYASTGLGRISKSFLQMLPEFEWVVWGFNHSEFHLKKGTQYPMFKEDDFKGKFKLLTPQTFTTDPYGLDLAVDVIKDEKPDFVITCMDFDRFGVAIDKLKNLQFTQDFKWVNYFPMDREDYKDLEAEGFRFPDINVCMTRFGVDKMHSIDPKMDIKQIYPAIEKADFPHMTTKEAMDFRLKFWPATDRDTFSIGTINRSFARKDTARLVTIFTDFLKQHKDSFAYLHGSRYTFEGIDLGKLAYERGLQEKKLAFLPPSMAEIDAVSQSDLNKIYRSLDLFVTVAGGEGFGFSAVEALLTETPVITPGNTSFPELIQDFGYIIPTAEMAFHQTKSTVMWPIVNIQAVLDQMNYVKDNYAEAKAKAKEGSKWVKKNLNLTTIAKEWRKVLV